MPTHTLKTDPDTFQAVWDGLKTFEIRLDDRGFAVGDWLMLHETQHSGAAMREGAPLVFTGRQTSRRVSHVLRGYGLQDNWVCLSFAPLTGVDSVCGFILEAATAGELAAYEHASAEHCAATANILDGKDDGSGTSVEPWATVRKRLLEVTADARRMQWAQFHGAYVAWGNDGEWCDVRWGDRDGSYRTGLHHDWRAAFDAAREGNGVQHV